MRSDATHVWVEDDDEQQHVLPRSEIITAQPNGRNAGIGFSLVAGLGAAAALGGVAILDNLDGAPPCPRDGNCQFNRALLSLTALFVIVPVGIAACATGVVGASIGWYKYHVSKAALAPPEAEVSLAPQLAIDPSSGSASAGILVSF